MHDHIEEMGKNIVRRLHPNEPNKHSRLWIDEEIEDILSNDMGTEETRCLRLDMWRENSRILMNGLGKMKKLRYLDVEFAIDNNWESDPKLKGQYFTKSLKYLKCSDYPFLYLPKTFQANNLVGLEIYRSRMVQLWKKGEKKVLKNLKFLSLYESNWTTFDFRITPNLETLSLSDFPNLVELCMPVSCQKLKHLSINDSKLRTFDLRLTSNIETLSLYNSPNLVELFMPRSCQKLKHLKITYSKLRTFDLGLSPNLERLYLPNSADFEELHVSAACPNLKFLNLKKSRLRSLDLELIPNLERLELQECHELVEINAPVGCLKKVGYLNLSGCLRFPQFKFPVGSSFSAALHLEGKSLDLCPLHPNSNLPKLQFYCSYQENLPSSVGNFEKLISFGLCPCTDLTKISDIICSLQCLEKLTLYCNIPEFPKDLGQLECLEELCLSSTQITHLPDSICMLKRLKSLELSEGDLLEKLPEDLGRLECLEKLHVRSKKIEYLPDSICMLKRLKLLKVASCHRLGKLPEDIDLLESLKSLNLSNCALLDKLPEDLGRLECLKELDITDTGISHLPPSIFGLKGLLITASSELLQLYDFPSEIKTTTFSIWWSTGSSSGGSTNSDCGSMNSDCGSMNSDCGSTDSDCGSMNSDCGSMNSDCGSTNSDCGSMNSDCGSTDLD